MIESQTRALSATPSLSPYYRVLFWGYVAIALIIFTFVIPPFQKNDEPLHFYRTVSITNLDFFCSKDAQGKYYSSIKRKYLDLPTVLGAEPIWASLDAKFSTKLLRSDFSDPKFDEEAPAYSICNLAVIGYIPNAVGLLLGKPLESPVVGFYLGRMAGVAFFVVCLWLALGIVPDRYRVIVCFYGVLPMVLHQVSSFSYDAVQLALFPLIFAYLTRFLSEGRLASRRDLLVFLALVWLTAGIKSFAYYGILLLYFVIPWDRVASTVRGYLATTAAFFGLTAASMATLESVYLDRSGLVNPAGGPIAPKEQLRFTLEHPWDFAAACYRTVEAHGEVILRQGVGVFGWVGFEVNFAVIYLFVLLAALLTYYLAEHDESIMGPPRLGVLWLTVLVTVASLFFSLYAVWSPVRAPVISGLQGRYFLGLVPFAILAVTQTVTLAGQDAAAKALTFLVALLIVASAFFAVLHRYY